MKLTCHEKVKSLLRGSERTGRSEPRVKYMGCVKFRAVNQSIYGPSWEFQLRAKADRKN